VQPSVVDNAIAGRFRFAWLWDKASKCLAPGSLSIISPPSRTNATAPHTSPELSFSLYLLVKRLLHVCTLRHLEHGYISTNPHTD